MKQMTRRWLAAAGLVAMALAIQGCSANRKVQGSAGFQTSSSSNWGSSISFGVHTHGRGW